MKKKLITKKVVGAFLAVSVVVSSVVATNVIKTAKNSEAHFGKSDTVINILHTNDIHGDVENLSYIAEYKDRTNDAILLDAGDASQGKPIATYTKGEAIIDLMNKAGYDASTIGNHEFDFGKEQLLVNIKAAKFPYLAANVRNEDGTAFAKIKRRKDANGEYTIIKKAGKRIGVFGISTTETVYQTNPTNIVGVKFEDEAKAAQVMTDKLKAKGCDLVVALMHVGIDGTSNTTSLKIAEEVKGLDVLIDGHSHSEVNQKVGDTYVVQTGTQLKTLGKVTVTFSNNKTYINSELLSQEQYQVYGKDKAVDKEYIKKTKKLEPILNKVIGNTSTDLIANETNEAGENIRLVRNRETSMGDLTADSMLWGAKEFLKSTDYAKIPVVALSNGGGVRANISAGKITIGDVFSVLPFGNTLSMKIVTPDILYQVLEYSISGLSLDEKKNVSGFVGSYPQISGMRFEMDLTKTPYAEGKNEGSRIVAVYLKDENGKEKLLDRKDTKTEIAFASNNFLIAGGDGFTMLSNLKHIAEGNVLDEILADYVTLLTEQSNGCFEYKMDGNRSVEINSKKK